MLIYVTHRKFTAMFRLGLKNAGSILENEAGDEQSDLCRWGESETLLCSPSGKMTLRVEFGVSVCVF